MFQRVLFALLCMVTGAIVMVLILKGPDLVTQGQALLMSKGGGNTLAPHPSPTPLKAGPPAPTAPSATQPDSSTQFSDDDYLPKGVPVKRTDWVISKDYAGHGGNDPVSREKWGAVDFAFWHDKDAFGSEIIATHAGTINLLEDDPTYGNLVYVIGPHYTTTYAHMQKFNVTKGQVVSRGDVMGFMGSTGNSTGPHVDYQVWKDGKNQNPMDYCQCGTKGPGAP